MEKNIDPMIAGGVQAPERALDPECRVSEREILRRRLERKPNPAQTVRRRQKMVFRYVEIVIPNETAVPRGPVSENRREYKNHRKQPDALRQRGEEFSFIHQDLNYQQIIPHAGTRRASTENNRALLNFSQSFAWSVKFLLQRAFRSAKNDTTGIR